MIVVSKLIELGLWDFFDSIIDENYVVWILVCFVGFGVVSDYYGIVSIVFG